MKGDFQPTRQFQIAAVVKGHIVLEGQFENRHPRPPGRFSFNSSATSRFFSFRRPAMMMHQPASANLVPMPLPMPLFPPVTIAVRLFMESHKLLLRGIAMVLHTLTGATGSSCIRGVIISKASTTTGTAPKNEKE